MLSRNTFKIFSLLLVSVILVVLAVACGAQPAEPQTVIQTVVVEKEVEKEGRQWPGHVAGHRVRDG